MMEMHGLNRQYHIQLENMMLKHWVLKISL